MWKQQQVLLGEKKYFGKFCFDSILLNYVRKSSVLPRSELETAFFSGIS